MPVVEVREIVLVEVMVVDPSVQDGHGTTTVVICVSVLQVEVMVVTPPIHVVHGTVTVVRKGVVGTVTVDVTGLVVFEYELTEVDWGATGVLDDDTLVVRTITGVLEDDEDDDNDDDEDEDEDEDVTKMTVVTGVTVVVVFML